MAILYVNAQCHFVLVEFLAMVALHFMHFVLSGIVVHSEHVNVSGSGTFVLFVAKVACETVAFVEDFSVL